MRKDDKLGITVDIRFIRFDVIQSIINHNDKIKKKRYFLKMYKYLQ